MIRDLILIAGAVAIAAGCSNAKLIGTGYVSECIGLKYYRLGAKNKIEVYDSCAIPPKLVMTEHYDGSIEINDLSWARKYVFD